MLRISRKGQSILEYTLVLGVVAFSMITMARFLQRSTQGMVRMVADQVGIQNQADLSVNEASEGYLISAYSEAEFITDKVSSDQVGNISYSMNDKLFSLSDSVTNLGFTESLAQ